ncbi:MAG: type II toxin-antitoxin system HicA family toxin [Bacteroidales bacterium]|nr:type II toxin-antitoxin system HicA family toxin [Bacteroidales bacterium]
MSTKEKLRERFKALPNDFTFNEVITLLKGYGYVLHNKGKTSGSRIRFINEKTKCWIDLHKPHPGSIMKTWMLKALYDHLKENNLL